MSFRARRVGAFYLLLGVWNIGAALHVATAYGPVVRYSDPSNLAVVAMVFTAFVMGVASAIGACRFLLHHEWGRRTLVTSTRLFAAGCVVVAFGLAAYALWRGPLLLVLVPLAALAPWLWVLTALMRALRATPL